MDGLTEYRVRLLEDCDAFTQPDDMEPIWFECWAEDQAHACEQAENAYPNCSILFWTLKED